MLRRFLSQSKIHLASHSTKPYFLEVMAIFKNESHILDEWVRHYISEGADKIHLINNNSEDDYLQILRPYINSGKVSLTHDTRYKAQLLAYEDLLPQLKLETEWLIICDLDEFIYSRRGFVTIKNYLESIPRSTSAIQIPWKIFGSSGFIKQPDGGVVRNFCNRYSYHQMPKSHYGWYYGKIPCKYITRPAATKYLGCHRADLLFGNNQLSNGELAKTSNWQYISESILERSSLHLNHYALQSQEYYLDVKMPRGGGVTPREKLKRNLEWFTRNDNNDILDNELALKWKYCFAE